MDCSGPRPRAKPSASSVRWWKNTASFTTARPAPASPSRLPMIARFGSWRSSAGKDWTPDSGRPGGVWCAQRIPDGEAGCSANRSRIGTVDLDDRAHFLASDNVFSLAEELGLWKSGTPFVWHDVYGCLWRPWRSVELAARMAGLESGRPFAGVEVHGEPRCGSLPLFGET